MTANPQSRAIRLGVNSVLFAAYDFRTACRHIAASGYDGVEISAIKGMCEHLELDGWRRQAAELRSIVADCGLQFLSMEEAGLDEKRLEAAFEAAAAIGIPVVNIGSGGKTGVEEDFLRQTDLIAKVADRAHAHGVTLCVKAHVGAAIHDTKTTLRAMERISSPGFGVDMDPSHIHRAKERPEEALPRVLSRVRHIHIRDCLGDGPSPGTPQLQACGRGSIDLYAYCKAMVDGRYAGPVCLEVIGARDLPLPEVSIIAAESYGYLNACLKRLGAR
jgi:sugar phosphate isomerase/epimerase